ncbi:MAG: tetraacyldisaccharide 4'-kinase [Sulfurospirillum sp.]|nr:MAG: tetraacyldisaccharide 4'-kinase [Sulfurospirillum sp.]
MKHRIYFWVERYLFHPNGIQKFISFLLYPFSLLYCSYVTVRRKLAKAKNYGIPVVSVGNLIVGGSGKTPFTIALAKKLHEVADVAVVLRGYGRRSRGLIVVSQNGVIMSDVEKSGDEALLLARSLPHASIIVSEDRVKGLQKAKEMGATVVILDDGFSKAHIEKFDILLKPSVVFDNEFCLPAGPFREPASLYRKADLTAVENVDFTRSVEILNRSERMVLVTAISKPERLNKFVPPFIERVFFPDHYRFQERELAKILREYNADSILTTQKDAVKMENFRIDLSILALEIELSPKIVERVKKYIVNFDKIS